MAYDSPMYVEMIQPMRVELTSIGFQELHTPEEVEQAFAKSGTTMVVINSICGCAAGIARPAIRTALETGSKPDHLVTVFAGQDVDATAQARTHFTGFASSSPSIAFLKDGKFTSLIERRQIEKHATQDVANLVREEIDHIM